jgi:hypothetical protein
MMGSGFDMPYPVFLELLLKPGASPPVGVLTSIVGEHLLAYSIFTSGPAIHLQNVLGGLAPI